VEGHVTQFNAAQQKIKLGTLIPSLIIYCMMLCVSTVIAVGWCTSIDLSIHPLVTLMYCIETAEDIESISCVTNGWWRWRV